MIRRIIEKIKVIIARQVGPVMIAGFRSSDGSWKKNTRYGSTTYFQGKEEIEMGDYVCIAQGCFIEAYNGLKIGEGVQIGSWTTLTTHSSHQSIRLYGKHYGGTKMLGYNRGSISIGAYTFIGPHVIVMPNTKIGKGSLVAAYSNVTGDFPDFAVISGNPAKVVADTRYMDRDYLESNPELQSHYDEWAKIEENDGK